MVLNYILAELLMSVLMVTDKWIDEWTDKYTTTTKICLQNVRFGIHILTVCINLPGASILLIDNSCQFTADYCQVYCWLISVLLQFNVSFTADLCQFTDNWYKFTTDCCPMSVCYWLITAVGLQHITVYFSTHCCLLPTTEYYQFTTD